MSPAHPKLCSVYSQSQHKYGENVTVLWVAMTDCHGGWWPGVGGGEWGKQLVWRLLVWKKLNQNCELYLPIVNTNAQATRTANTELAELNDASKNSNHDPLTLLSLINAFIAWGHWVVVVVVVVVGVGWMARTAIQVPCVPWAKKKIAFLSRITSDALMVAKGTEHARKEKRSDQG